jgi:hypothetical protein
MHIIQFTDLASCVWREVSINLNGNRVSGLLRKYGECYWLDIPDIGAIPITEALFYKLKPQEVERQ